jgi:hypothetical protein
MGPLTFETPLGFTGGLGNSTGDIELTDAFGDEVTNAPANIGSSGLSLIHLTLPIGGFLPLMETGDAA